jgi:SAM-dependent methyltransferase
MWDQRYSEPGFAYGTEPNDFFKEIWQQIPDGPVLFIGEGEGRNAVFLARQGRHQVHAVDASAVGLDKAARLAAEQGVSIEATVADLDYYDLGRQRWAGIVEIFCHMPPDLRRRVHRAVVAALRPGGALALEAYTPQQLEYRTGGPPALERLYTLQELRENLQGLRLERAEEKLREVHEGRYHDGAGAVVQILAFKPMVSDTPI